MTGAEADQISGRLFLFWGWACMNTADGTLRGTPARLAKSFGGDESFWRAVESVGWLSFCDEARTLTIPGWGVRFSKAAKARLLDSRRKAVSRAKTDDVRVLSGSCPGVVRVLSGSCPVETGPEERRGEEIEEIQPSVVATTETRKPRSRSLPADSISWDSSGGWSGISDADRTAWRSAYPACDIAGELARMGEWLKANPAKAKKSRWRQFVTAWLTRSQDKGGGQVSNRSGGAPPPAWVERASWRDDACQNMTETKYRAWLATRRPPQEAQALARSLRRVEGESEQGRDEIGRQNASQTLTGP